MQNIHSHAWNQELHIAASTVREAELSRGYPLDLSVNFDDFMRDMEPFERVVVFGLKGRRTGYWVEDQYTADFVARAPHKLVGFACSDPTQPGAMEALRHGIENLGLRGLKLGPMYAGFDPRDSICDPLYGYCQDRGLPILFHTGTTFNRMAPLEQTLPRHWDEIAMRYPDLPMVMAHVGHPYCDECLVVIRKHPNLFADISALFYRPWQFYNMLILAQEYKVTHKLLFGTDYPFAKSGESIEGLRQVNRFTAGTSLPRVSEQVIEELLNRDSLKLLGVGR
jgi:predicted TIM-barrel fold metal-dependent hydrolase